MSSMPSAPLAFAQLDLPEPLQIAVRTLGFTTPTPVQARSIPVLLRGDDVIARAQTGTGKTAAFALPLLARVDARLAAPQVLVLAPTRELAVQVAEAFSDFAAQLPGVRVLPVYGGQDILAQMRGLARGPQVIVGTPGRVLDHVRRGSLELGGLRTLVLDEADEMLRMGFIEDVQWLLERLPEERQIALFSATMPAPIRAIAQRYLRAPEEIAVGPQQSTASTIRQRYWPVRGLARLDALTRILETEPADGVLIFVRTRQGTEELSQHLVGRGFACAALNGDMPQSARERTVEQLKQGRTNIVVATDVAARGLDVDRISHVINYDIPYDTEAYVHRIGRTGRAGRRGEAILFVAPRETRMLRIIERAIGQAIEPMQLPSVEQVNEQRRTRFLQRIGTAMEAEDIQVYVELVERYRTETGSDPMRIAAALARAMHADAPLLLPTGGSESSPKRPEAGPGGRRERGSHERGYGPDDTPRRARPVSRDDIGDEGTSVDMQSYRVEVGREHGVKPGQLVGAIANESGLDACYIGRIQIHDRHSTVVLPSGMPKEILAHLRRVWVAGRQLHMSRAGDGPVRTGGRAPHGAEPVSRKQRRRREPAPGRTRRRA
ncbi:MAG: DEAD/DEAH box helicase [Gammaproteobacteria bacterium]|nr:DEAD/DEAH box helicase [Gammaproteobacteria bacterium]